MRYIFLKKRRLRLIFITSLIALIICLLTVVGPLLLNNFKVYVQKRIARDFNIEVGIEKIGGGIISPLTFENIHILRKKNGCRLASFQANAVLPNYRIWDLFLAQVFGYKELVLVLSDGRLYFNSHTPMLTQIGGKVIVDKRQIKQINLIAGHKADKLSLAGKITEEGIPKLDLEFTYTKGVTKTTFNIEGPLRELELEGQVFVLDEKKIDFKSLLNISDEKIKIKDASFNQFYLAEGSYDFKTDKFTAKIFCPGQEKKSLTVDFALTDNVSLNETAPRPFLLSLNFNHFNLLGRDIISLLRARGKLFKDEEEKRRFTCKVSTHGTIIDQQPLDELEVFCDYKDSLLNIIWARWGLEHFASGTIDFSKHPPEINLVWKIKEMDSARFLPSSNQANGEPPLLEGKVSGKIYVEGNLFNPTIKVTLESKKGSLLGVKFASANVNLKDKYPILTLHDSRIYREEGGFFILDGKIDLRKAEPAEFFNDIKVLSDEKTIILDGWDISRRSDQSGFTMKRAFSENLKIGFETFVNKETQNLTEEEAAMELEYKLHGNRFLLMRFEKDKEFFGLKHGTKF